MNDEDHLNQQLAAQARRIALLEQRLNQLVDLVETVVGHALSKLELNAEEQEDNLIRLEAVLRIVAERLGVAA